MKTSIQKEKPRRNQSYDKYLTTKKTSLTKMPFSDKINIMAPKVTAINLADTPKSAKFLEGIKRRPSLSSNLQGLLFPSTENTKPNEMEETNTSSMSEISIKEDMAHSQIDSEMRKIQREVNQTSIEGLFDFDDVENKRDKTSIQMKQLFLMAAEKYKELQIGKESATEEKNKHRQHFVELCAQVKQEEEAHKILKAQVVELKTQNLQMLDEANVLKTKYEEAKNQIENESFKIDEHYQVEVSKMDALNLTINQSLQEFEKEKFLYEEKLEDQRIEMIDLEDSSREADIELADLLRKLKLVRQKEMNRQKLFGDMKGMVGILFTQYICKIVI